MQPSGPIALRAFAIVNNPPASDPSVPGEPDVGDART
jgi:hypothetical protein